MNESIENEKRSLSSFITTKNLANVIAVLTTGMFAGCTLMVGISFGQIWGTMSPDEFLDQFPHQFYFILMTVLPIVFLQVGSLIFSIRHDWNVVAVRKLWLMSLAAFFLNGVITAVYHLPEAIWISEGKYDATEATSILNTWLLLHIPRALLGLAAAYYAAIAVVESSKFHQKQEIII